MSTHHPTPYTPSDAPMPHGSWVQRSATWRVAVAVALAGVLWLVLLASLSAVE